MSDDEAFSRSVAVRGVASIASQVRPWQEHRTLEIAVETALMAMLILDRPETERVIRAITHRVNIEAAIQEDVQSASRWRGMATIVREVARIHNVSTAEILGEGRTRAAVVARHEAFWTCRQETRPDGRPRWSLPTIGRHFGRDHSTVLNGIRQHQARLVADTNSP